MECVGVCVLLAVMWSVWVCVTSSDVECVGVCY